MAGPTPSIASVCACQPPRFLRLVAVLAGALALQSCTIEVAAPPETGFLAIILSAQGTAVLGPSQRYSVRIRELSGTYNIDRRVSAAPNDTIIGTYPLASYVISVDSVPVACTSRIGNAQQALISTAGNTSITRFNFTCDALLGIVVAADGHQVDSSYVWTLTGPGGAQQYGVADAADTIRIDRITAGDYTIELGHVADNCILTSEGMRRQTVTVKPPAPSTAYFRVRCTNLARAPRILHMASSFRNGVAGFYAEVEELNLEDDVASFSWNITDCLGNPLFRNAGVTRDALRYDRTFGEDTARIAVTLPLPDTTADLSRACTALRFEDLEGNTTLWQEERNRNETGRPPVITRFEVVLVDGMLRTTLAASDPDNDLAGAFMTVSFRDGTQVSPPNGRPDIRPFNVAGYLPPFEIPALRADGSTFRLSDVLSVNVDVIDRAGNMTRAIDTNFTQ